MIRLRQEGGAFQGARFRVESGLTTCRETPSFGYRYLQLTLENVDHREVGALPHPMSITRELLRRNLLCFNDAEYGYDCVVGDGVTQWRSRGVVCICLALHDDYEKVRGLDQKREEVATSFERGLLDDMRRSRADFKLKSRPMLQKLTGLQESEYLPEHEWQVDVIFAQWYNEETGEWQTPLGILGDISLLTVSFPPVQRRRGFRVTDLF